MLAYPLTRTTEVHGASDAEPVAGITFAISADNQVYEGESVAVTLSVTGAWYDFYGFLYYNGTQFNGMIEPVVPDGYGWSGTYYISGLSLGCYNLTFWAKYWPEGWPAGWYGPVTVSVLVYVLEPEPTFTLVWRTPLSNKDLFETGRTIPIRFSVYDDVGGFKLDETVTVTVTDSDGDVVFHAAYGTHRSDVRIRESGKYYITYWKTAELPSGEYTISIEFEGFFVEPSSLSIWLR